MSHQTQDHLTAVFENRPAAEGALHRLRQAGVPDARLRLTEGASDHPGEAERGGLLKALGDFLLPERERERFAERLSRGGALVSVSGLDGEEREKVEGMLEAAGAVEVVEGAPRSAGLPEPGSRPVQPGFADVRPGFVPEPAAFPEIDTEGDQDPRKIADSKGRFADQLDKLPETRDPDRSPADAPQADPRLRD